uniref:Uncharacterized protein n=1 Tax=Amphimedon queenslandica TaxID=400682 RepID=A0A1X7UQM7_AMPQE
MVNLSSQTVPQAPKKNTSSLPSKGKVEPTSLTSPGFCPFTTKELRIKKNRNWKHSIVLIR